MKHCPNYFFQTKKTWYTNTSKIYMCVFGEACDNKDISSAAYGCSMIDIPDDFIYMGEEQK